MIVLLCRDLETLGNGLDLGAVAKWLEEQAPGVEVRRASGPCRSPERWLDGAVAGADRLVLGLCTTTGHRHELDANARKVEVDPFGLEVLNLGASCALAHPRPQATEKAKLLLEAGLARARAYAGSRPENVKPLLSWNGQLSRRSLLTLPPIRYEAVPSIREESCSARAGCRICAKACPREALRASDDGLVVLNKAQCTACGACVSLCPQTAIDFPGASPSQVEAQVAALLTSLPAALHPRGILFHCGKGVPALEALGRKGLSYPAGWLPVELPCLGMVTPAWILEPLNLGAAAVGLLGCPPAECRFGQRQILEGRADYCRELLRMMGGSPDAVRILDITDEAAMARGLSSLRPPEVSAAPNPAGGVRLSGARATAEAVLALAERYEAPPDGAVAHPHSTLGIVKINPGCTGCGACAFACPTRALVLERDEEAVSLAFDPRLCVACAECVPACPEAVLRVEKVTDFRTLSEGRRTLFRDREVRCESCGAPVAPRAMLDRISAILGEDRAVPAIVRYCLTCRGTLV
jgi:NAD-dependent dihydropyrimidine dehydrogenase PreA subunit/coenzyme F420-reducing hydrogenase delta subunit